MGINFGHSHSKINQTSNINQSHNAMELTEQKPYNIEEEKAAAYSALKNSPEIQSLVSQIEIDNIESITNFGGEAAESISGASDVVLRNVSMPQINESSELLNSLNKIMQQFKPDELQPKEEGIIDKLMGFLKGSLQKQLDSILNKYDTFGNEVDKIYVQLKKYESDIKYANRQQEELFQANVNYYKELVKYIVAGEAALEELNNVIENTKREYEQTKDNEIMLQIDSYTKFQSMLAQRVDDLRKAEMVAMQSLPAIRNQQYNNMHLVRKINSAFIVTLPIFKTTLAQAIMLKRQKMQADALAALDEKTNELISLNAKNTANQSKQIAKMTSGSSIKIETLEKSWKEIINGIQETERIQESAKRQREEDKRRLESIKEEFKKIYHVVGSKNL